MHVLRGRIDRLEPGEGLPHLGELGLVEQPGRVQPLGVQQRSLDVVRQQLGVVGL